ncbi:hypothetical protein F5877DRAFT_55616 [Lentinula edodes]|nr:hypothetical protein F5877DRAFT_55616 [Lentinula edodes]
MPNGQMADGLIVAMKHIKCLSNEKQIATFFSCSDHALNPSNHYIPIFETIVVPSSPNECILVMLWMQAVDIPKFRTIREVLQFVKEILEGLQYMHQNNIAHQDCSLNNMMIDAHSMYPKGYHPMRPEKTYNWKGKAPHCSHTCCPPRYYLIDFGFSQVYNQSDRQPLVDVIKSGGQVPPEGRKLGIKRINPFPADVYLVGTMICIHILEVHHCVGI